MKREVILLRPSEAGAGRTEISATLEAEGDAATLTLDDGRKLKTRAVGGGEYRVTEGEKSWRAMGASDGQTQWVFIDGEVYVIEVRVKGDDRRLTTANVHGLAAPMPATVIKILANAGQKVQRGETLLVLEAMKMELPVKAPADGVVKRVNCEQGQLVQPGVALVEME